MIFYYVPSQGLFRTFMQTVLSNWLHFGFTYLCMNTTHRAIAKVLLKDYEGALADFDTAISLNAFAAHSYFNRGNLHLAMGMCRMVVSCI